MIPTPQERGPLEPIDSSRFDLTPIEFNLGAEAAGADKQLAGADRRAGNLAAGIVDAGSEMNLANEENGQAVAQVEADSDAIQENVNPPGSELDQAVAWTPFVDLQLDVAERQIGPEAANAARAQPLTATTEPPASASPQEVRAAEATLLRVDTEEGG